MTKNNFKVILFAALIAAMILPVSIGQADATITKQIPKDIPKKTPPKYSEEYTTEQVLQMVTPYITVNEDKTVSLDIKSAVKNKVPKLVILKAIEIIKQQNELVKGERTDIQDMPTEFTSTPGMSVQAEGISMQALGCNWAAQTEAPNRYSFSTYQSTLAASKAWLTGIGYHNVAGYALHPNAWDNPAIAERDFQLSVSAHGCEPGVFRAEAYLYQDNVYGYSSPEPNPEYLDTSYTWPVWYWPGYVVSWHSTH